MSKKQKTAPQKTTHDIKRERNAQAMHNLPTKVTDTSSYEEMLLSSLLEQQQENAKTLRSMIELPNGIGFTSPHYVPVLQNLLALAFRIDGFRHAFSDPLDGVQIPTQEENRRWNQMLAAEDDTDGR